MASHFQCLGFDGRRAARDVLFLVALLAISNPSSRAAEFHDPLGHIYLSNDSAAPPGVCPRSAVTAAPYAPFDFYLMMDIDWADVDQPERNATDGAAAFEASVTIPPPLLVLARNCMAPLRCEGDWVNVQRLSDDWIAGFGGECATGDATPVALVRYTAFLLGPASDLLVTLGPVANSSFGGPGGPGPAPGWLACQGTEHLYPFDGRNGAHGWLYVNWLEPCGLPIPELSWSALKAAHAAVAR